MIQVQYKGFDLNYKEEYKERLNRVDLLIEYR